MTAEVTAGTGDVHVITRRAACGEAGTDGSAVAFLYDYKRLLHETDEVGWRHSQTYATTTTEEFGDLFRREPARTSTQYDAQRDTNRALG